MELNHLRHFYWVVKEGNFTNASKVLKIAQPSISRMVRLLEESLGHPLLVRHKRHVSLTQLGAQVFRHCEIIFDNAEQIRKIAKADLDAVKGSFALGCADSVSVHIVPGMLVQYLQQFPAVTPSIQAGPTELLIERIAEKKLDFGLFFYLPKTTPVDLESTKLIEFNFKAVALAKKKGDPKSNRSFIGSREADSSNVSSYPTLSLLRKKYGQVEIRVSSNQLLLHKQLVLNGLGVSVLPEFMVRQELKSRILRDILPEQQLRFSLKLIKPKANSLSPASEAFLKCFLSHARAWS